MACMWMVYVGKGICIEYTECPKATATTKWQPSTHTGTSICMKRKLNWSVFDTSVVCVKKCERSRGGGTALTSILTFRV